MDRQVNGQSSEVLKHTQIKTALQALHWRLKAKHAPEKHVFFLSVIKKTGGRISQQSFYTRLKINSSAPASLLKTLDSKPRKILN